MDPPDRYNHLDVFFSSSRVVVCKKPNSFAFEQFFAVYDRYPELELSREIADAGLKRFRPERVEVAPFILKALFETSPSIRRSLGNLQPFKGKPYIALHARLGHGLGEHTSRFDFKRRGLTLRSASECIGALAATMARRKGYERVFIATDTERARKWLEIGIHTVIPHAQVAQSPINATHMQALFNKKLFFFKSVRRKKFEEVFVDLGLLAMAKSMVFFRSGFAQGATWFGAMTDSVSVLFDDCAQMHAENRDISARPKKRSSKARMELLGAYSQFQRDRNV
ncbi:hypothetical protein FGB62_180g08 [Gracilaria domingensis]|nr:hypothetical protein FGB62_180g08 [Gracilaria domingensis]